MHVTSRDDQPPQASSNPASIAAAAAAGLSAPQPVPNGGHTMCSAPTARASAIAARTAARTGAAEPSGAAGRSIVGAAMSQRTPPRPPCVPGRPGAAPRALASGVIGTAMARPTRNVGGVGGVGREGGRRRSCSGFGWALSGQPACQPKRAAMAASKPPPMQHEVFDGVSSAVRGALSSRALTSARMTAARGRCPKRSASASAIPSADARGEQRSSSVAVELAQAAGTCRMVAARAIRERVVDPLPMRRSTPSTPRSRSPKMIFFLVFFLRAPENA